MDLEFDSRLELWVQGSVAFISFSEVYNPNCNNNKAEIYLVLTEDLSALHVLTCLVFLMIL